MKKSILITVLCIQFLSQATVQIINIPSQDAVVKDFSKDKSLQQMLVDLITGRRDRITYMTPREARAYFSDNLLKTLGTEKGTQIINKYFNEHYFVNKKKDKDSSSLIDMAKNDPYLSTHLSNALSKEKVKIEAMEPSKWNPAVRLLSPDQIYNLYLNNQSGWYIEKLKKEGLDSLEKYREKYPEKANAIFSKQFFGMPHDVSEGSFGILTQEIMKNIYSVAKKIMQQTQQGDYIIIFGNTPYFVGRALEKISSRNRNNNNFRHIIMFPFSGSPNQYRIGSLNWYQDLVTKERLEHLKKRMEQAGLTPKNNDLLHKKIYLVDVLGSGGGPAYMLEQLIRMFQEAKKPIPDLNIIALNQIDITGKYDDIRNALIAKQNAQDGESVTFFFPSINETHFSISGKVIYLEGHWALDNLPSLDWRMLPEYNAMYWVPEYDYLLKQKISPVTEKILEYFDNSIEYLQKAS